MCVAGEQYGTAGAPCGEDFDGLGSRDTGDLGAVGEHGDDAGAFPAALSGDGQKGLTEEARRPGEVGNDGVDEGINGRARFVRGDAWGVVFEIDAFVADDVKEPEIDGHGVALSVRLGLDEDLRAGGVPAIELGGIEFFVDKPRQERGLRHDVKKTGEREGMGEHTVNLLSGVFGRGLDRGDGQRQALRGDVDGDFLGDWRFGRLRERAVRARKRTYKTKGISEVHGRSPSKGTTNLIAVLTVKVYRGFLLMANLLVFMGSFVGGQSPPRPPEMCERATRLGRVALSHIS